MIRNREVSRFLVAVIGAAALLAWTWSPSAPHGTPPWPGAPPPSRLPPLRTFGFPLPQSVIKHVVIVMQENRSFNYLFAGYPHATTALSGLDSRGNVVQLTPQSLAAGYDLGHQSYDFFAACDGSPSGQNCRMDGFDLESHNGTHKSDPQYRYAPRNEVRPYWDMARQYVLGDDMHASQLDASFTSHQYIIAGQAASAVNIPSGTWGCGGGPSDTVPTLTQNRSMGPPESPCQNYTTLGDELDGAGLPWRFYVAPAPDAGSLWSAYQAVQHIFSGPDWTNDVITDPAEFLTDVGGGTLGAVTWVMPTAANSDHSSTGSTTGPQWVASVVNAVGLSPFWSTTAIFVFWDEWGGWYDPVPPPYEDYDGLGFRVPLLVISPYAKRNYVSHVQYEHGSILRFVEDTFGLLQLSAADARANDPARDCFDFSQKPRTFKPLKTALPRGFFLHKPPSRLPLDEE